MRTINFSAPITNLRGDNFKEKDETGKEIELTLGLVVGNSLMAPSQATTNLTGSQFVKRLRLAETVINGGSHEMTDKQIALMREAIEKLPQLGPTVIARSVLLLEPDLKVDED